MREKTYRKYICIFIIVFVFWFLHINKCLSLTLDQAINEAIKNNYLIKNKLEMIYASVGEEKIERSFMLPVLSSSYSYERLKEKPYAIFDNPIIPGNRYKVRIGDRDRFYWNIVLTQPIFTGFSLITRYKIAKFGVALKKVYREKAILDIVRDVKVTYFNVLLAKRYLEIAKEEVSQLESHFKDAKAFFKQGIIPYNDLLKSEVALAQARQNLVRAKSNLKVAISRLNIILEKKVDENTKIEDIKSFIPINYKLDKLYANAIKYRPEIKAIKIAIKQAKQKIRLAKSDYYPHIYLFAKYEQQGNDIGATNNDYGNSHNASIGFQAKWNIFEWGRTKAEVERASHEYKALCYELKKAEDNIRLQVKNSFEQLKVAKQNLKTAETALIQAKENHRITDLRYQQKLTTSTEVLDARTFLTQAEVNYYNALYGYMIAKAELERAIGESQK